MSKFTKKADLANLNSNVDKLDIDKLKNVPTNSSNFKSKTDKLDADKLVPVPVDLSKLSDIVKNDVVEKDVYNAKIKNIEDKIPDITNLATNTTLYSEINKVKTTDLLLILMLKNEVKNKILIITNLATTTALTAVENKLPNVSNLVTKTDYNTKFSEI